MSTAPGPKIFISYRRDDSAYVAGMLHDRLSESFGPDSVFLDIDNIPLGVDFRDHVSAAVGQCGVLLALIGDTWAGQNVGTASRRIDDPADHLRLEIEAALNRNIPVIPVLIGTARMPKVEELPSSLQTLAFRNAAELRPGRDFHHHLQTLLQGIDGLLRPKSAKAPPAAHPEPKIAPGVIPPAGAEAPRRAAPLEAAPPQPVKSAAAAPEPLPAVARQPSSKSKPIKESLWIALIIQLVAVVGTFISAQDSPKAWGGGGAVISLVGLATAIFAWRQASRIGIAMGLSALVVTVLTFLLIYANGWTPAQADTPLKCIAALYATGYIMALTGYKLRSTASS